MTAVGFFFWMGSFFSPLTFFRGLTSVGFTHLTRQLLIHLELLTPSLSLKLRLSSAMTGCCHFYPFWACLSSFASGCSLQNPVPVIIGDAEGPVWRRSWNFRRERKEKDEKSLHHLEDRKEKENLDRIQTHNLLIAWWMLFCCNMTKSLKPNLTTAHFVSLRPVFCSVILLNQQQRRPLASHY